MSEQNGIDILCDAAGSDLILGPLFSAPAATAPATATEQPTKRVKLSDDSSSSPAPTHICHICKRVYERADHLTRHLRSRTYLHPVTPERGILTLPLDENARPYQCTRCPKRFNRALVNVDSMCGRSWQLKPRSDLLTRHETTHDRDDGGKGRPIIRRSERAAEACTSCASSKAKCDDQKPCSRCRNKGLVCQTASKRPPMFGNSPFEGAESTLVSWGSTNSSGTPAYAVEHKLSNQSTGQANTGNGTSAMSHMQEFVATADHPMDGSFMDDMFYFNPTHNVFQDVDFTSWDLDFDTYTIPQLDFQGPSPQSSSASVTRPAQIVRDPSRGHAAFKRSPWLWEPKSKDCLTREQAGLMLDEETIANSPAYDKMMTSRSSKLKMGPGNRDKLFALVLSQAKGSKVPSFPPLELLNYLIQTHFVQDEYQMDNWIHSASFDPSNAIPELVASVISSGATFISMPAIWQFGLALQEIVRIGISVVFESSNVYTRDLECLQAYMLNLDVGLWSGFKRKMEIAESFLQPITTMLRRAGTFSPPADNPALIPSLTDSPEVLDGKWKNFVKRESFKRLAIHLFVHDVQASVSFQKNPLVSYTELSFTLPASRDLWRAPTAEAWRDVYLRKKTLPPDVTLLRVSDIMHCMTILDMYEDLVDVELCYSVVLNGFWGQIHAYREAVKFYRTGISSASQRTSTHHLWLNSQHQELYRDLTEFALRISNSHKSAAQLAIVAELFMMILHISPADLQCFAGKMGEEEARHVSERLEHCWVHHSEARHSIWHAGQVFRHARLLPPASLRGFNAIAVYFAALTLKVYGILKSNSVDMQQDAAPPTCVLMDGEESRESRAFLQLGKGVPGITQKGDAFSGVECLLKPGVVLDIARNMFRDNYPVRSEPLPPLVENLENLLRDLDSGLAGRPSRVGSRSASEDR